MDITAYFAREAKVAAAKVAALREGAASPAFSELEKAALRFADGMTATPARVEAADFDALRQAYGDAGLVELAGAAATENFSARFNHAFEIGAHGLADRPA